MTMITDGLDFENIQVGSSQLWVPSNICTDPTIFRHIFSLNTWNTVFSPEQKERILKMLPTELVSSPGGAAGTIEDLLSGTLTRFNSNPLETFFKELNMGGYDPEVVEIKVKMKREWRRDLLRRKRHYHTKLMQEVIIASQTSLQKFRDKSLSKQDSGVNSSKSEVKIVKVIQKEGGTTTAMKGPGTPKKKSNSSKPSPLRQKVAKRLHNEIQAMSQAFPSSVSSTDGPPALKKPKPKAKKPNSKIVGGTAGIVTNPVKVTPSDLQQPPQLLSSSLSSTTRVGVKPGHPELGHQGIQMAKFPSVIPPSLLGVINVTQSPAGLSNPPKPFVSLNHYDVKVPSSLDFTPPPTTNNTLISPQVMQKHVLKSSPILASQLQAPIVSSGNLKPATVVVQLQKIKIEPPNLKTVKTEEESSSDEDEFEAIEPTIGFSTMLPSGNKLSPSHNQRNLNNSKSQVGFNNARVAQQTGSGGGGNKIVTVNKKKGGGMQQRVVVTQSMANPTVPSNMSTINQPPSVVNVKVTNSKAIITTAAPPCPAVANNKVNLKLNSVKVNPLVPFVTNRPPVTTQTTNTSSNMSRLLPITLSNLTQQSSTPITLGQSRSGLFHVPSSVSTMSQYGLPSTSQVPGGIIVNGAGSLMSSSPRSSSSTIHFTTSTAVSSISSPTTTSVHLGQFGPLASSSPTVNHRISAGAPSPLPLTLSDLSLSLNLGLEMRGDKMEGDKIDDLAVLDGNAFDSIPNLSDDLDVFDLDLVDGLCDFEVMLSEEKQYSSFFGLIREVLCSTQNHRMTFSCLEKTVQKWSLGPSAEHNPWFHRLSCWNDALVTALNFLAGNYQEIHPEDFVPYLEYKYKTKYYQWIGAGRDSDGNLLMLCNMWLENLEKLPPMKKQDGENEEQEEEEDENEDSDDHAEEVKKKYLRPKTPPPPRFVTEWTVRPSTYEEKEEFQAQEKVRFDNPHKAFTYRMHKYESVVGPVKGVYSNQTGVTNKARGHSLLVDERPPYVTILALVRDSVARLPNGEGTRSEICEMLRDSTFLAPEASNVTLNSVVSGALDRLHYERDPCVRYDSHKKNWIYLHRDRSQDQFERLHHNRSYTKSTKSRNSGGRKSRKKTLSQNSGTSIPDSTTSNPIPSSSSSTPATTPKISAPPNLVTDTLQPVTSDMSGSARVTPPPSTMSSAKSGTVNSVFVSATTGSSPTIQFAIPVTSGGQILLNKCDSSEPVVQQTKTQLPTYAEATNLAANQPSSSGPQTASTKGLNIKLDTQILPVSLSSPVTTNSSSASATPTLQQQSFILNNLFRLPNLKLPDNVRFMRIQQTPAGQVQVNPLRLPQQRIVLRPAYPGHVPGQGVIFGQTPTGQTVIISAIGSPQVLTTQSFQTHSTAQALDTKLPPTFTTPTLVNMLSTSSLAATNPATLSTSSSHTSNSYMLSGPGVSRIVQSTVTSGGQVISTGPSSSVVRLASSPVATRTLTVPTRMTSVMGGNISPSVAGPGADPGNSPSPVVIRSNQMEYLLPGHHVSIGKGGLHGIKMVPGNQIFARLVAPTAATAGTVVTQTQPTANTNTKALK